MQFTLLVGWESGPPTSSTPNASSTDEVRPTFSKVSTSSRDLTHASATPRTGNPSLMAFESEDNCSQTKPQAKVAITVLIDQDLKLRGQTAVLRAVSSADDPRTFVSFVEGALRRELERLACKLNAGVPFEPNEGLFRTGRPPSRSS